MAVKSQNILDSGTHFSRINTKEHFRVDVFIYLFVLLFYLFFSERPTFTHTIFVNIEVNYFKNMKRKHKMS